MNAQQRIGLVVQELHKLVESCLPGKTTFIDYLTLFAQNEKDYKSLNEELERLGSKQETNNGIKYKLSTPFQIGTETISLVRVRKPDVHRKEFGCVDLRFDSVTYDSLRSLALEKGWDIIVRKTFEMIELSTFDTNVYAYIVKEL